ncbi:hypothetical protein D3C87_41420 [compost metagenome]
MKTLLTSAFIVLTSIIFAQTPPEKYQQIWNDINEGDGSYAQNELKKIIRTKPKDPWPYWLMGIALYQGKDTKEQADYFELAIAADSTFAPAYGNLASCLKSLDPSSISRVEKLYTQAIALDPGDNHNYVARADLYLEQKKYDLAIKDAKNAKLIEAMDCYFANQIIIKALYEQGKTADLKLFLKLNDPNDGGGPPDGDYQYFLGELHESWGEHKKACPYYQQAVSDTEFMLDIVDPGVLDEKLALYRKKVAATCQ